MRFAAEREAPDLILHLGDHYNDAQQLRQYFPDADIRAVMGNCDGYSYGGSELILTLDGVKIYMSHGHAYGVKTGLGALAGHAAELGANLALYGHTHRAAIRIKRGITVMCPGQMERNDARYAASYGIVTIENGAFDAKIIKLPAVINN